MGIGLWSPAYQGFIFLANQDPHLQHLSCHVANQGWSARHSVGLMPAQEIPIYLPTPV